MHILNSTPSKGWQKNTEEHVRTFHQSTKFHPLAYSELHHVPGARKCNQKTSWRLFRKKIDRYQLTFPLHISSRTHFLYRWFAPSWVDRMMHTRFRKKGFYIPVPYKNHEGTHCWVFTQTTMGLSDSKTPQTWFRVFHKLGGKHVIRALSVLCKEPRGGEERLEKQVEHHCYHADLYQRTGVCCLTACCYKDTPGVQFWGKKLMFSSINQFVVDLQNARKC